MTMQRKEKLTSRNYWGETPVVTDDPTNKGLRPRNPPTNPGRAKKADYRFFRLPVDLLDTTNKGFSTPLTREILLRSMTMFFHQESSDDRTY